MTVQAFTIGAEAGYDEALAEATEDDPVMKGVTFAGGQRAVYPGGIVYETAEEALEAAEKATGEEAAYAAYELALQGWDDVYEHRSGKLLLKVDRPVVGKVTEEQA